MPHDQIAILQRKFEGVLLGTAVGDAIGLPREGLSRRRAQRIFGGPPLRHRLLFGRGMTSDDTEHTCMVAQSLLAAHGDVERFARSLAWRLRGWLLGFPAGVGWATARAIIKLWVGFPPHRSGVWSAGNGPAMRAAIIGAYACNDRDRLRQLVHVSTRLTHTDPAAEHGALAIALAAEHAIKSGDVAVDPETYLASLHDELHGTPILQLIETAVRGAQRGNSLAEYLDAQGLSRGISGYVNHTVPAALFCWLRWPTDFRTAVEQVVLAGGDSDTTGAIVGGLVGLTANSDAIPREWLDGLVDWPRSVRWMRQLAATLAESCREPIDFQKPVPLFWPALLARNLLFLIVVIVHGFRRLLPPY